MGIQPSDRTVGKRSHCVLHAAFIEYNLGVVADIGVTLLLVPQADPEQNAGRLLQNLRKIFPSHYLGKLSLIHI